MERLFRPRSIAVIGGGAWGRAVLRACREIGYKGRLYAVHPSAAEIEGVAAVPDVASLPEAPDAAFVGVKRDTTIEVVAALAARGAGGAVCFASGFREAAAEDAGGGPAQSALVAAAGEMPILGPNCYGFVNCLDRVALWPDVHGARPVERGVAILTQSSNIALNLSMQRRGLPIAYLATVGNQAQRGLAEVGGALLEDERVTALGLHVEGVGDLRAAEALAARAEALGKPVAVLKVGRSAAARAAAVSHTASLAGSAEGAAALFARLGFHQVEGLGTLVETLKILHVAGPLASNRIVSMSCSGGEASLIADLAEPRGLAFPPLVPAQAQGLRAALGPRVALANPLDYHTYVWGDTQAMAAAFTAMMASDAALGVVVLDFPRESCGPVPGWDGAAEAVGLAQRASGRPMALLASLPENLPEPRAEALAAAGIVPLTGFEDALAAIAAAVTRPRDARPLLLPEAAPDAAGTLLSEAEAKAALARHGVPVPRGIRVARDAAGAGDPPFGYPAVVKGEGVAHKSEAGAVALGIADAAGIARAAERMAGTHVLIEEMVTGGVAELLIGVVADPAHGYVLTLASGGVLSEILADSQFLLVPAAPGQVRAALGRLRIAPVLAGYRGRPGVDMEQLVSAVMALQAFVEAERPLEVEINPLICGADFAVAADALIRLNGRTG